MGQNLITKRSQCRETLWKSYTQEQELTYTQRLNIPIASPVSLQGRTLIFIPLVNITSNCFVATSSSFHPPWGGLRRNAGVQEASLHNKHPGCGLRRAIYKWLLINPRPTLHIQSHHLFSLSRTFACNGGVWPKDSRLQMWRRRDGNDPLITSRNLLN